MPPVQHVPLCKLMPAAAQDVFSGQGGIALKQGTAVLQLIPETIGPAALVYRGAGEHPTGLNLILPPESQVMVEGFIRCDNLQAAAAVLP